MRLRKSKMPWAPGLSPVAKELVIQSLLSAIQADGMVSVEEAELLRVICASLHCPLPL